MTLTVAVSTSFYQPIYYMRNNIILFFLIALLVQTRAFAQESREASLKGYNDTNYFRYFDSIHKLRNERFERLSHSYQFYVAFKIDTNSMVFDLDVIELPGINLPEVVKTYIRNLIVSTNGKWWPQIKKGNEIISDDLVYLVSFIKKNQTVEERARDAERELIADLNNSALNEKVKAFGVSTKSRYITLSY